jgi:hypothetical protein
VHALPAPKSFPDGTCTPCPTGQIARHNTCALCNSGAPAWGEDRCNCAGQREVNTLGGQCVECSSDQVRSGRRCADCQLGSLAVPGENLCACGDHQHRLTDSTCACDESFVSAPDGQSCIPDVGRKCGTLSTLACTGGEYCLPADLRLTGGDRCVSSCGDYGLFAEEATRTCVTPDCTGERQVPDARAGRCVPCGSIEVEEMDQCFACGTGNRDPIRDGNRCVSDCDAWSVAPPDASLPSMRHPMRDQPVNAAQTRLGPRPVAPPAWHSGPATALFPMAIAWPRRWTGEPFSATRPDGGRVVSRAAPGSSSIWRIGDCVA